MCNVHKLSALELASFIIKKYDEYGYKVNNLKLNKILFLIWARYFCRYKKICFDDSVEMWRHGGVVRSVYECYKRYLAYNINIDDKYVVLNYIPQKINEELFHICNDTIKNTLNMDAWDMVRIIRSAPYFNKFYRHNRLNIINPKDLTEYREREFEVWKEEAVPK